MCKIIRLSAIVMLVVLSTRQVFSVEVDKSAGYHTIVDQVLEKYEKAFNSADAKAIGALWKKDGEFIGPLGNKIVGREAIEKVFQDFFKQNPKAKLSITVVSLKEEDDGQVVVAEILPRVTPTLSGDIGAEKSTIVLVRSDENWMIEGVKETMQDPPAYRHLKEYEWMIGTWKAEQQTASDTEKNNPIDITFTCHWTANKTFLIRTFTTKLQHAEFHGTEIIGWDPQMELIRSWAFESSGGFSQSTWKSDGKYCVIDSKGVLAGGETVSSSTLAKKIDDNTFTIQSQKRMRGNKSQPDLSTITMRRVKSADKDEKKPVDKDEQ